MKHESVDVKKLTRGQVAYLLDVTPPAVSLFRDNHGLPFDRDEVTGKITYNSRAVHRWSVDRQIAKQGFLKRNQQRK